MIPKVVASEIGTAQTLRLPYGLTARVIKGVEILDKFYAGTLRVTLKVLFEGVRSAAARVVAPPARGDGPGGRAPKKVFSELP